jgi:hypothetical protein
MYLLAIEYEVREQELQKAKLIFHQAITTCSWAKVLYLYPFGKLRPVFSTSELQELLLMMEEKEIRLICPKII